MSEDKKLVMISLGRNTRNVITCLHASGKSLYFGTGLGQIKHWYVKAEKGELGEIDYSYDEKVYPDDRPKFPPIDQIDTDPDTGLLFYLSDKKLFIHNSQTLKRKLGGSDRICKQNIRMFALDKKEKKRIALATHSNQILIYTYAKNGELVRKLSQSSPPISTVAKDILTMSFMGRYLSYSVKGQAGTGPYILVRLHSGKGKETIISDKKWGEVENRQVKPQILALDTTANSILLKYGKRVSPSKADGSFYYDPKNEYVSILYSDLEFSSEPGQIALSKPFVGAIIRKSTQRSDIEIQNLYREPNVADDKQRSSVKNYKIATTSIKFITASSDAFYVSTDANTVHIIPLPNIEEQEQALINDLFTKKAKDLSISSGRKSKIATMYEQAGFAHLFSGEITEGFKNFNEAIQQARKDKKPPMDIRKILAHFTTSTLEEHGIVTYLTDKVTKFGSPSLVNPELLGPYKKDNYLSVEIYNFLQKPKGGQTIKDISTLEVGSGGFKKSMACLLTYKAENRLIIFLETHRNPSCDSSRVDEQVAIDYALLKLYLQRMKTDATAIQKIENIVRNKNSCLIPNDSDLFKTLLHNNKCYRLSALLHLSKGKIGESLRLLKKLGTKKQYEEEDKSVDGIKETVEILSKSEDFALMKLSKWVLEKKPEEGIKIFTAKRKNPPKPKDVLEFLSTYHYDIQQHYLRYLITVEKNNEEKYHTEYGISLINNLAVIKPKKESVISPLVKARAGEEPGLVGLYRRDLIEHLKLNKFDYEEIRVKLKDTNLYIEKAILYTNKGKYIEALAVILCELKDKKLAEQYCDSLNKKTTSIEKDVPIASNSFNPYLIIYLKVCFSTHNSKDSEQRLLWAWDLLNSRADDINPVEALKVIPGESEISKIKNFLKKSIKNSQHRYKKSIVLKNLADTFNFETRKNHKIITSQNVNINLQTPCCVCETESRKQPNIGESVFAVFPDLSICHVRCLKTKKGSDKKVTHIHPVLGVNFSKYPAPIKVQNKLPN